MASSEGEQLVLGTNILVHWLRGKKAGEKLRAEYELGVRRPRPILWTLHETKG